MSIAKLAQQKPVSAKKGPDCSVCKALVELPEGDATGLRMMLADKTRRYTEIAADIQADEDTPDWVRLIHHSTYARHAKGECAARENLRANQ